ncbi:hypothetical protein CWR48_15610 [Oceanobacillus arenosus]|uniref:DNA polymerase III beta sliding clamp C-terminal domain-containing protein n=1 Tax=Oceanobacillus arenosus TaxID=1229153 RepID=A0A3D8PND9_9BACI|nr:hypothetical protein [Oceanobacillus arenosus]RDW17027.1 hypothetical protein CWR48_15610 [Oceanobacillus arenosus]
MLEKLLDKHAKNFVTNERQDGKLEGIHYHENGSIYVTDAHKLLVFHDAHQEEAHTVHYKTGKQMDIKYPEVARLLDSDYQDSLTIQMKDINSYIDLIKVATNIDLVGDLILKDGQFKLEIKYTNESFNLLIGETKSEFKVCLNILYFYHMLHFFKDAKVDEIIFSWSHPMRPLSFRSGNYEILVVPVRRY